MMNETLRTLTERRSCRSYRQEQIRDEELQTVLNAGMYAPSAMGKQRTRIIALQNADDIRKLSAMNAAVMNGDSDPFYGAPTVIIVLAENESRTGREDGSLVLGNMMNAAYSIGLGSCWINRAYEEFETEEGKALLEKWGVGTGWTGVGHCILGYPEGELGEAAPRKKDFVTIVR